jgi:hypothetical protein
MATGLPELDGRPTQCALAGLALPVVARACGCVAENRKPLRGPRVADGSAGQDRFAVVNAGSWTPAFDPYA